MAGSFASPPFAFIVLPDQHRARSRVHLPVEGAAAAMVNIVPLDGERHAGKGWRRPNGYTYASGEAVGALVGAEFDRAAVCMPIAFIRQSGRHIPVGVMSPVHGRNLFVGPSGQWLGSLRASRSTQLSLLFGSPGRQRPVHPLHRR
jgi:SapC